LQTSESGCVELDDSYSYIVRTVTKD